MRRDLAVCRTALGTSTSDTRSGEQTTGSGAKSGVKPDDHMPETSQDTDVTMTGNSPEVLKELPPQLVPTAISSVEKQTESQPPGPVADQSQTSQQAREPLQLDIPSGEHTGSDNPTDAATGTFSNYDFESLFNDPSAHPSPDVQPTDQNQQSEPEPEPQQPAPKQPEPQQPEPVPASVPAESQPGTNMPANANQTTTIDMTQDDPDSDLFDFGDLTTFEETGNNENATLPDDDNINSLLPGLESYANAPTDPAPTTTDNTFNIFDAAGGPNFGGEGASNNAAQGQENISDHQQRQSQQPQGSGDQPEPHDDTFDSLMNFDNFDMGSFGNGDDSGDGDGSGGGAFDASFFDIS